MELMLRKKSKGEGGRRRFFTVMDKKRTVVLDVVFVEGERRG